MDEVMSTRERILNCALKLFAQRGFGEVSVREIARDGGVRESALYKHFKNKQDIFNSILDGMTRRYNETVQKIGMPDGNMTEVVNRYAKMPEDFLVRISKELFLFFLKDEYAVLYRRMLTIGQYSNTMAREAFSDKFLGEAFEFQRELFQRMIEIKKFVPCDSRVMALQFYGPIYWMLCKYDDQPEAWPDALILLEKHVRQFAKMYSI